MANVVNKSSYNSRNPAPTDGRAKARADANTAALAASTGNAGLEEGDAAKASVTRSADSPVQDAT